MFLEQNPPKYDGYFQLPVAATADLPEDEPLSAEGGECMTIIKYRSLVVQPLPFLLTWKCSPEEAEALNVTLVDFGKGII